MPVMLRQFAAVNDVASATRSKLKKSSIVSDFLRQLDEEDLPIAINFFAARPFAATDERVLGASGAFVSEVLIQTLGISPHEFYDRCVKAGEAGEAIAPIWPAPSPGPAGEGRPALSAAEGGEGRRTQHLTLHELREHFDQLARVSKPENKRAILHDLFACCIDGREAAYICKIIFGDMRTGIQEGILQSAVAEAFNKTLAEIQRAQLLIGDLGQVALLAKHHRLHEAKFQLFHPIQFMLAQPQDSPEIAIKTMNGRTFIAEDKLDGIRAQVHKSGDRVVIYTRTMDRTEDSFPDVVEEIQKVCGDFLLDGEILAWREGIALPFAHIQRRLGRKILSPQILRENPAKFVPFDILYLNGEMLMDVPLHQRKEKLATLALPPLPFEHVSTVEQIEEAFSAARDRRNEGVVLKDPNSLYTPGRRGGSWLKLKTHLPTIDAVITATEYGNGKRRSSLSDYTFAVWSGDRLVNIGKAYIGVSDEEINQLTEKLHALSIGQYGRTHLVQPKIVLEIACDSIQKSNRHASGFALRFPRVKRIRWDKRAEDADTLERVREIYESSENFAHGGHEGVEKVPEPTLFDHF